ncbi:Telomere length regulation protein elg1 [Grifola frondosa]|uniref:Telomere length regulation protein elg1 n=1 Tax=Grifola frondosa TaxID=5627 RepID=A0A1C7LU95_GRIFR|nr:Telomere length regulation protein elg1 [Grifola frondosa]
MSRPTKKVATKKVTNTKSSRQTSLLDVFTIKSSAKKDTRGDEVEDLSSDRHADVVALSSDVEIIEIPEDSSSPIPLDNDNASNRQTEYGSQPRSQAPANDTIARRHPHERNFNLRTAGSRDIPIVVDHSPSTSPTVASEVRPPPKALYSIFAPRPKDIACASASNRLHAKVPLAPYPDSETQHVRGPQTTFHSGEFQQEDECSSGSGTFVDHAPSFAYATLLRHNEVEARPALSHVLPTYLSSTTPLQGSDTSTAFQRIIDATLASVVSWKILPWRTTSDQLRLKRHGQKKWRPKRAEEVIGNEQNALYLRDWLLALRLHIQAAHESQRPAVFNRKGKQKAKAKKTKNKDDKSAKRPRIIRDVVRKRRRLDSEEPEGTWSAHETDSDEGFAEPLTDGEAEFVPRKLARLKRGSKETTEPLSPTPSSLVPLTAAVYACAEELGWDVFEVYPGTGERSGAALNKLIGDVGKNHLVRQTQYQQGAKENDSLVGLGTRRFRRIDSDDEDEADVMQGNGRDGSPAKEPPVSQSIVLVEEVDVLYGDDANFWPALIKIIKECRRPVVMTCNDPSLVPVATSYLQALCLAEHCVVNRLSITRLYERIDGFLDNGKSDVFLHPRPIARGTPDLRRAINHLQFWTDAHATCDKEDTDQEELQILKRMARHYECVSFVDSYLRRRPADVLKDLMANDASSPADSQLGYTILSDAESSLTSPLYSRHTIAMKPSLRIFSAMS